MKSKTLVILTLVVVLLAVTAAVQATTFIVPTDREMVRRADAIAVATATTSYVQLTPRGGIETVTVMASEETIKGDPGAVFEVHEPGGFYDGRATIVPGAPLFRIGDRAILLLTMTPQGYWAVTDLVLGKFRLTADVLGNEVAVRDEGDVVGWDPDGTPHREARRASEGFLNFVRSAVRGGPANEDYLIDPKPLVNDQPKAMGMMSRQPVSLATAAAFSATSYAFEVGSGRGARWAVFPNPVTFFANASGEPGAPGNGFTTVQSALATWTNDCPSNISYSYGGTDSTHTAGLSGPDGANTVLFERDLTAYGAPAFTCSANSYSGTLGIGGVTTTSGTNVVNSETFFSTAEGDVEMNRGIANCSLLLNSGDWPSALTHELGHTLGFRHSDQTRADNPSVPCTSDPSLECSSSAIMTAVVTHGVNGALQAWDQHAAAAVYPGGSCTTCTPPAITSGPASQTINAGGSATLTVTASGTTPLSFQWFVGASGNTTSPIQGQTGSSITVSPASTTSYWVRVTNGCGSANSPTATVTVNAAPLRRARWDLDGDGKDDILWRDNSSGQNVVWLMNGSTTKSGAFISNATSNVRLAAAADFNGDGKTDLLWRDPSTGLNYMWLMNGFNIIGGGQIQTFDAAYNLAAAIDFNGDGTADILWHNDATGQNVMWLMNSVTVIGSGPIQATTNNVRLVGAADFNGDGKGDLFWRDAATGANYIWLMNSFALNGGGQVTTVDPAYNLAAAVDFNNDGKADVLWHNDATGQSVMWLMNGSTAVSGSFIQSVNSAFRFGGAGDFDGNGTGDILWHNPTTGANMVWLMSGFGVTNSANLTTTTTSFTPVIPRGR
jgi:FG-GAP-like repeat/Ig-like domain CHU_C associated